MRVRKILELTSGSTFPICPRCHCTLDRDYQRFCDRCGLCINATLSSSNTTLSSSNSILSTRTTTNSTHNACVGVDDRVYGRSDSDCPAGMVYVSSPLNSRSATQKPRVVTPPISTVTTFARAGACWRGRIRSHGCAARLLCVPRLSLTP